MIIFEKDDLGRSIVEIVFDKAGSIYAKEGVAYFISHILNTKGTLEKKEKFYSYTEQDAIEFNTSVNREFFTVSVKFLNSKKNKAVNLLKELLSEPNITKESFEKSKKEISAKIQSKKNDNDYIAGSNLFKNIFSGTPLAKPVTGDNIEEITLEDLKTFYNALFKKEWTVINGGEKTDLQKITAMFHPVKQNTLSFTPQKQNTVYEYKNVEQSYIHFASPFNTDYSKELYLAKTATFILGAGGFGSRMMEEIRVKRGYAYSAYASNAFRKSYKLLSGYLQTKLENTNDAVELVKELIYTFQTKGVTAGELEQAKQFLIGSEPLRNETLSQRLLKKFNEHYLELPENYYEKELALIQDITLEEINSFIKNRPEINDITFSIVTKE
jgi:predicted Zn-dependent peptidase